MPDVAVEVSREGETASVITGRRTFWGRIDSKVPKELEPSPLVDGSNKF
jgi:hypothetical protein